MNSLAPSRFFKVRWLLATMTAGIAVGCSLLLDLPEATQCSNDAQCKGISAFNGAGVCDQARKVCIAASSPITEAGSDAPPDLADCTTNAECTTRLNAPAVCLKGAKKCHALESENCKISPLEHSDAGAATSSPLLKDENLVLFGMIDDLQQATAELRVNSALLAFREVNKFANGLPGTPATQQKRRPIVLITCNYGLDKDKGYEHLKELEIPAIIGPVKSDALQLLANNHTIPGGMLMMGTHSQSPVLTTIKDSGLLWRPAPSGSFQGPAMRLLVKQFETEMRTALTLAATPPPDYLRVGLAALNTPFGLAVTSTFTDKLAWNNGLSNQLSTPPAFTPVDGGVASTSTQEAYRSIGYDGVPASINPAAISFAGFGPHMMAIVGNEDSAQMVSKMESSWVDAKYPYRPLYIINNNGRTVDLLLTMPAAAARRVRGVSFLGKTENYPKYAADFTREFGINLPSEDDSQFAYDAAYLLIYGYFAAGDVPRVSGTDVANGIRRLLPITSTTPKAAVGPGPNSGLINETFAQLASSSNVDLVGVSGQLDLNPTTGEPTAESTIIEVFCVQDDVGQTPPRKFAFSGQTYDAKLDTIVGTYNSTGLCIP